MVSPIPVQTAKAMGADLVIAVDISARPTGNQPVSMWGLLDQTLNIMGQQSINQELAQANIVIQPKVGHIGTLDLKASNQTILEGEKAAQLQVKAILQAINNFKKITCRAETCTASEILGFSDFFNIHKLIDLLK